MARIIVSYYKVQEVSIRTPLCFWDGFVKELKNAGNDVFVINTAYFNPYSINEIRNAQLNFHLLEKAKAFDPELIITFNHRIPKSFLDAFDVPIVIWDGDELSFFCDHDYIRKNIERYKIFSISRGWLQDYRDFGFASNQIFYVPQATAVQKQNIRQTMNVSFLGIRHFHNAKYAAMIRTKKYGNRFYSLVEEFLNTGNYDYKYLFDKYFEDDFPDLYMGLRDLYPLFDYRWLVLANMLDLGLTICGHESRWEDVAEFMPQIAAAYNPRRIWTLEENNWFYNSSKVSMCPVTAQARGSAFSWRVFDIMASNACLLISEASDLRGMTKDYLDIPMYRTPWEARDLCKKMLEDDAFRTEIVTACQRYVNENARWIHRFADMQQITGIRVINANTDGNVYDAVLDDEEVLKFASKTGVVGRSAGSAEDGREKRLSTYQIIRQKVKSFCYKWSKRDVIKKIVKIGMVLILPSLCLLATGSDFQYIALALGAAGGIAISYAILLGVINVILQIRKSRWGK